MLAVGDEAVPATLRAEAMDEDFWWNPVEWQWSIPWRYPEPWVFDYHRYLFFPPFHSRRGMTLPPLPPKKLGVTLPKWK